MRRFLLIAACLAAVSCARPLSSEPFILKENAEYGDTYSFNLDCPDSSAVYSLSFYARLERKAFKPFPAEGLRLVLRWTSPSDSSFSQTVVLRTRAAADSSYFDKDYIWKFKSGVVVPEHGVWRLKAQVLNNPEELRGLGIIFKEKKDGTR